MSRRSKLELTWIGKETRPRLEPRILLEEPSLSHHAPRRVSEGDLFDSRVIFGDNLLALKALEQEFTGKIKCVCIDPPYNTGSAFTHYDDGIEHSLWLTMMNQRLYFLKALLSQDGSIWIFVDDSESHYLKVLCDEIFGRDNFVATVIWEKSDSPRMDAQFFSARHDFILVYAKNAEEMTFNKLPQTSENTPTHYDKVDSEGRRYYLKPLRAMGGQGDSRKARPNLYYSLVAPDDSEIYPQRTDGSDGAWRWSKDKVEKESKRIDWIQGRNNWTPYFRIFADTQAGRPPETIWFHGDVGSNRTSKNEAKSVLPEVISFATPKPERVIQRILHIATQPGDWVLDSFAGSGTTGAVAHKMGRRFVLIELGEHCHTHILPRLCKVVDGEDKGGVTAATGWQGGGGFRYFRLAPSLLEQDRWGNYVINKEYNPEMLAAAICKHEGFTYTPSETDYWNHGFSTERDFIYVTTQSLSQEQLAHLSEEVGTERSLLVCASAFPVSGRAAESAFPNLTLRKIPNAIVGRCEWGRDDYSLAIANLPPATPDDDPPDAAPPRPRKTRKPDTDDPNLFDQ